MQSIASTTLDGMATRDLVARQTSAPTRNDAPMRLTRIAIELRG